MKILQMVQQPQRRGAEMFAYDLSVELRRRGHSVSTAYLYPGMAGQTLPLLSDDVALDADPRHVFERVPGVDPRVVRRLLKLVDELRPDIVQANGARTLKYGSILHRFAGHDAFRLVYRSIGDPTVWVTGTVRRTIYRNIIMPQVDGVAAVSKNTLLGLQDIYGLEEQSVAQIPRGIDPERVAPTLSRLDQRNLLSVGPDDPVVVFVGSLTREKRPDRLARVFKRVLAEVPDAHLWVIGDGPERGPLEALLSALGTRVHLSGDTDDVGSYLGGADVLLLTSDTEGLPGVVLEAAALGVPSVATDVGGVGDAISSGTTGLLADPADEHALASATAALLTNQEEKLRLGLAAQQQFLEQFSIQTVTQQYENLYREVISADQRI